MKRFRIICLLFLCSFFVARVQAQGVGGGLSLAGVASQIDGDNWGGYNKLGLHFGGFAYYDLTEKLSLMAEILYGHRGSREVRNGYGQIALNYIDVPLLLRYRLAGDSESGLLAHAGTSVNILLQANSGFKPIKMDFTDIYRRFTMEAHIGAEYYFNQNFGLLARWSISYVNLLPNYPPWLNTHYFSVGFRASFKR